MSFFRKIIVYYKSSGSPRWLCKMNGSNDQIVLIFILSSIFVVLLATLLVLFLVIYQKRIVAQENRLQKLENERQQVLLKATIEGQERERKRLAKDLHDGIGSLLSGLSLNLKFQKSREPQNSEQYEFLDQACNLVEKSIQNIRTVSHNLLPATLENFGLVTAMEECVKPLVLNSNIQVNIDSNDPSYRSSDEIELGLLRVFQELLQNSLKHASATKIRCRIEVLEKSISMAYFDDGIGIGKVNSKQNGIGLKNIESRIASLNGVFVIDGQTDSGFQAEISIPRIENT